MSVQYLYEVPSPSFHMVPHSPFMRKTPAIGSSPVATVPDVDTSRTFLTKDASYKGRQPQLFTMESASPLPSGRVPSVSPRTPLNNNITQPREQQVPSQTPIRRKDTSSKPPPLDLFSDDDSIFL